MCVQSTYRLTDCIDFDTNKLEISFVCWSMPTVRTLLHRIYRPDDECMIYFDARARFSQESESNFLFYMICHATLAVRQHTYSRYVYMITIPPVYIAALAAHEKGNLKTSQFKHN